MSGALCDAVLRDDRSAQTLETLERTNGFVVPLDRRGEWYRYHHLFGELLRNELERSEPEMVRALNGRAMVWCIANDLPEAAVGYGHAAGETDTVAGLLEALVLPLCYDGRMETVEEWLGWFGDEELVRYPALAVNGAWLRVLTGRPAEAERWLALADGATSAIPLSDGSATIEPWVANLRGHMMGDGVEQALADADLALERLAPESVWMPTRAAHSRRCACAARRDGSGDGRPHRRRRAGAGHRRLRRGLPGRSAAGAARGRHGAWGEARGEHARRHRRWSRRRVWATTPRARSRTR